MQICRHVYMICRHIGMMHRHVGMIRRHVNMICRHVDMICRHVSMICRCVYMICRHVSVICRYVSMICRCVGMICRYEDIICRLYIWYVDMAKIMWTFMPAVMSHVFILPAPQGKDPYGGCLSVQALPQASPTCMNYWLLVHSKVNEDTERIHLDTSSRFLWLQHPHA